MRACGATTDNKYTAPSARGSGAHTTNGEAPIDGSSDLRCRYRTEGKTYSAEFPHTLPADQVQKTSVRQLQVQVANICFQDNKYKCNTCDYQTKSRRKFERHIWDDLHAFDSLACFHNAHPDGERDCSHYRSLIGVLDIVRTISHSDLVKQIENQQFPDDRACLEEATSEKSAEESNQIRAANYEETVIGKGKRVWGSPVPHYKADEGDKTAEVRTNMTQDMKEEARGILKSGKRKAMQPPCHESSDDEETDASRRDDSDDSDNDPDWDGKENKNKKASSQNIPLFMRRKRPKVVGKLIGSKLTPENMPKNSQIEASPEHQLDVENVDEEEEISSISSTETQASCSTDPASNTAPSSSAKAQASKFISPVSVKETVSNENASSAKSAPRPNRDNWKPGPPSMLFPCSVEDCSYSTSIMSEYSAHFRNRHPTREDYVCPHCSSTHPKLVALTDHLSSNILQYQQCPVCGVSNKSVGVIKNHIHDCHHPSRLKPSLDIFVSCHRLSSHCNLEDKEYVCSCTYATFHLKELFDHQEQCERYQRAQGAVKLSSSSAPNSQAPSTARANTVVQQQREIQPATATTSSKYQTSRLATTTGASPKPEESSTSTASQKVMKSTAPENLSKHSHLKVAQESQSLPLERFGEGMIRKCSKCDYETAFQVFHDAHEALHSHPPASGDLSCSKCPYVCGKRELLVQHVAGHAVSPRLRLYCCIHCSQASTSLETTEAHLEASHPGEEFRFECKLIKVFEFTCPDAGCSMSPYASELDLIKHVASQHAETVLQEYVRSIYGTEIAPPTMTAAIPPPTLLKKSISAQDPPKSKKGPTKRSIIVEFQAGLRCTACEFACKDADVWATHCNSHGKTGDVSVFYCRMCEWLASTKSAMLTHCSDIHSMATNLAATLGYGVKKVAAIVEQSKKAKLSVSQPRTFTTGKESSSNEARLGNRYKCELCPFATDSDKRLEKHLAMHEKQLQIDNGFKCAYCVVRAKYKSDVLIHLKRYHGDEPIKLVPIIDGEVMKNRPVT